uniref:Response regulator n=1 Tax=Acidobacterium capsulatum TaxID=33075 RepID=A0A7V4XT46_9BACT
MTMTKQEILLVDDDECIRLSMSQILSENGNSVRSAENGLAALARIREQMPHILVSDLNMPGMSGFELLAVVRFRFPQIQVIAMSGQFSGTGIPPGVAADAFYEKGRDPELLLNILESMRHTECLLETAVAGTLAPVWIPVNGKDAENNLSAIVSCPECLRRFPIIIDEPSSDVSEAACVYCKSPIRFVSAPATRAALLHTFPRDPGGAMPSSLGVPDGD